MALFIDVVNIVIKAGNGGDGCVNFHREKYVPRGGPDGGDGGRGGDIIFEADPNMLTLLDFRYNAKFEAQDGNYGESNNRTGKSGEHLTIRVPPGTLIKLKGNDAIVADMMKPGTSQRVLRGGRGGKGNAKFATPTRQKPSFALPGQKAKEYEVSLELKSIADVGLVGFPNVGKSTLLSRVSKAKPKIANYHFTTLSPNLGVVKSDESSFVMADIPGIIENASEGAGLGHKFLRHIERTRMLVHILDISGIEGRDPIEDYEQIMGELNKYSEKLTKIPMIIAANKMDLPGSEDNLQLIKEHLPDTEIIAISAATNSGLQTLLRAITKMLVTLPPIEPEVEEAIVLNSLVDDNFTIQIDEDGVYVVEGNKIERLLASNSLSSGESLRNFQRVLRLSGIIDALVRAGAKDGDTVKMDYMEFDFVE